MKVLSISTDRKVFDQNSPVRARMIEYGKLFEEMHIIVFSKQSHGFEAWRISDNVWLYPTRSFTKLFYMRDAFKIAKQIITLRKWDPKTVVVTAQDPFETGKVGADIKKSFGFPLQIQVHTDFLSPYFYSLSILNKIRVKMSRGILEHADIIRVVSERIKRSLVTQYFIPDTKISVLPIFVESTLFNTEPNPAQVNLQRAYPQFAFTILMASRLTKEKNIFLALRTLKEVLKNYPKTGLIIVGDGPEERSLKSHVAAMGLQNSVVFEPWQKDLAGYYKSAHAFLVTSLYEGYGLTLVEAGLSGAAIITSDVGIAGDILKDSYNALVYPVDKQPALLQKLLTIIENNDLRLELKLHVAEDMKKVVLSDKTEYLRLYKEFLQGNIQA